MTIFFGLFYSSPWLSPRTFLLSKLTSFKSKKNELIKIMSFIAEIHELAWGAGFYRFTDDYEAVIHNDGSGNWDLITPEGDYVSDTTTRSLPTGR
jgi:hypothetical protein